MWFQEIPEFLSHEECDHIISLAKDSGLRTSTSGFSTYDGDLDEDLALAGEVMLLEGSFSFSKRFPDESHIDWITQLVRELFVSELTDRLVKWTNRLSNKLFID